MVASPIEDTLSSILNGTDNFPKYYPALPPSKMPNYYITTDEEVAAFEAAESTSRCSQ